MKNLIKCSLLALCMLSLSSAVQASRPNIPERFTGHFQNPGPGHGFAGFDVEIYPNGYLAATAFTQSGDRNVLFWGYVDRSGVLRNGRNSKYGTDGYGTCSAKIVQGIITLRFSTGDGDSGILAAFKLTDAAPLFAGGQYLRVYVPGNGYHYVYFVGANYAWDNDARKYVRYIYRRTGPNSATVAFGTNTLQLTFTDGGWDEEGTVTGTSPNGSFRGEFSMYDLKDGR